METEQQMELELEIGKKKLSLLASRVSRYLLSRIFRPIRLICNLVHCPGDLLKTMLIRQAKASVASLWRTCTWTRKWLASPSECLIIVILKVSPNEQVGEGQWGLR